MDLLVGDAVEVRGREDGFWGSYYEATVVGRNGNLYAVQYKNLLKEDESEPLTEIVAADALRPPPPPVSTSSFAIKDKVDAFDNDGWWIGKVVGIDDSNYLVYFPYYDVALEYPISRLRVHHRWVDGNWFRSRSHAVRC